LSSFATQDVQRAKQSCGGTLDLRVSEPWDGLLRLPLVADRDVPVYRKPDHTLVRYRRGWTGRVRRWFRAARPAPTDAKGIDRGEEVVWSTEPASTFLPVRA
jgi:hypothetical protein